MKLYIKRFEYGDSWTIGRLYIDGEYFCYTLEDKYRGDAPKVKGNTCIPVGTYQVTIDFSNRFQKDMPHILDVPQFEGIRIHSGNTDKDTEGCILLGETWAGGDFVGQSRAAYDRFFQKFKEVGKATLTIH